MVQKMIPKNEKEEKTDFPELENRLDNPGMIFSLHEDRQALTPMISYNTKFYQNDYRSRE